MRNTTVFLAAMVATALASTATAQGRQQNWVPNSYRLHCDHGGACLPPGLVHRLVSTLRLAVGAIRDIGFNAPKNFGPRFQAGAGDDHIRVLESGGNSLAFASLDCKGGPDIISFGQGVKQWTSYPYLMHYFTAHEMFHIVQWGYAGANSCMLKVPGWLGEATADAVGLAVTRKRFPKHFPSVKSDREAGKFSGLRRYDAPLNIQFSKSTGQTYQYRTSSFFRHLAEAYNGGSYKYLHRFFLTRPDRSDWLNWLGNRVLTDSNIKKHLWFVYAGFVADFAGWGDRGMPGHYYGRSKWLKRAFHGCKKVTLTPTDAAAEVPMSLRPTSAQCVEIEVAGIKADHRVSVQIAATTPPVAPSAGKAKPAVDELHISLASSTDSERFHCAKWIRGKGPKSVRGKAALDRCVFLPDTGTLKVGGKKLDARVWNVPAQSIRRGGGFSNVYLVSRTAPKPTDKHSGSDNVLKSKLYFVLTFADVEATGADARPTNSKRKAIPHLNTQKATGSVESIPGAPAASAGILAYVPNLGSIIGGAPTFHSDSGLSNVSITVADIVSRGPYADSFLDSETYSITPVAPEPPVPGRAQKWRPISLALGATGPVRATIHWGDGKG